MTAEPLGPALAAELGGVWNELLRRVQLANGDALYCALSGRVYLLSLGPNPIGTFSDGVEALAAEARRLGVA